MQTINTKLKKARGFTIVELLVVIVVIGILAAITIVSYSGITNRANTSASQSTANNVLQKAGAYQAESASSSWPATLSALTGAAATTSYALPGVTYAAMGTVNTNTTVPAAVPTAPAANNGIIYAVCGVQASGTNPAPASYAQIITITGIKVYYWDYQLATNATPITAGTISGLVGTQNVACAAAGS